jgi:hypothetical protein
VLVLSEGVLVIETDAKNCIHEFDTGTVASD